MEKQVRTEIEQVRFFDQCYARFDMAAASVGVVRRYYKVGGTNVCLAFAGKKLIGVLTPALEHLRVPRSDAPDLTLCIWDSESTSVQMVPPPCDKACFTDRGDIWGFTSNRIKTAFHWIENSVNVMDLDRRIGIFWVQTIKSLPFWVYASPLRTLFHWWMEMKGCQLVHAAAVATNKGAVLVTGKGGVGKSTTALCCLRSGLYYLSDDYVIVQLEPEAIVHSLYCTAKLNAEDLDIFHDYSKYIGNSGKLDQEKAVMFLYPHLEKQILTKMSLKAIFIPKVVNLETTRISPISFWAIQRAMSFTTMSHLPNVGRHTHEFITRLSRRLPGYNLELGCVRDEIPGVISDFLNHQLSIRNHNVETPSLPGPRPLVSAIIPVYNGERFIREAIDNVLSQEYPALELIIVNDGSTDGTEKIIDKVNADIRYFKQDNQGPAVARNRGIREASGELIVFLDADDLWPENNLNLLVDEILREYEMDVVRGYAQLVEKDPNTDEFEFIGNPREAFPHYIGAAIYRRSVFKEVGLFDSMLLFGEDKDWFTRAQELRTKIKRLEEVTLYVRRHEGNMTKGKDLVELNVIRVFKKALDRARRGV